jgi:hypothetical protein
MLTMNLTKLRLWMGQGTSILGASGATVLLINYFMGVTDGKTTCIRLVGCAIAILMPQNTAAQLNATQLASALLNRFMDGPTGQVTLAATNVVLPPTTAPRIVTTTAGPSIISKQAKP